MRRHSLINLCLVAFLTVSLLLTSTRPSLAAGSSPQTPKPSQTIYSEGEIVTVSWTEFMVQFDLTVTKSPCSSQATVVYRKRNVRDTSLNGFLSPKMRTLTIGRLPAGDYSLQVSGTRMDAVGWRWRVNDLYSFTVVRAPAEYVTNKGGVPVWTSPAFTSLKIRKLGAGTFVSIVSLRRNAEGYLWGSTLNGTWIYMGDLSLGVAPTFVAGQYVTKTDREPLRKTPSSRAATLRTLGPHTLLTISSTCYNDLGEKWGVVEGGYIDMRKVAYVPYAWPVPGYKHISSTYGNRRPMPTADGRMTSDFHGGIDIPAPAGTKVYAACSGVVAEKGYDKTRGNYVLVRNTDGKFTYYGHLSKFGSGIEVKATVAKGTTIIGYVGRTGLVVGKNPEHLHFAVGTTPKTWTRDGSVNPLDYVHPPN